MKLKSKYNIGQIVEYKTINDEGIGKIVSIDISFSFETRQKTEYKITKIENYYSTVYGKSFLIKEYDICKALNKSAFEKEYAKMKARQVEKKVEE